MACNGEVSDSGEYENLVNPIYDKIGEYVKKLGLYIYYQTDPRGATIYVDKNRIPENDYTRAYCVY